MTAKEIAAVLNENGIAYDKDFLSIDSASFASEACRELVAEMTEYLSKLVKSGMNNGFNGSMRDAIKDITKKCVDLQMRNTKAVKRLPKYRDEFEHIKAELDVDSVGPNLRFKETVIKYIDEQINALEFLKQTVKSNGYKEEAEKKKIIKEKDEDIRRLTELRSAVSVVLDNASASACGYAKDIINCLRTASTYIVVDQDVDKAVGEAYDRAIDIAAKWAKNKTAVKKREVSKESIEFVPESDDLTIVGMSMGIRAAADSFRARLAEYKRRIERPEDTERLEAEIASADEELAKIEKKRNEDIFAVKAGKMTTTAFRASYERDEVTIKRIKMRREDAQKQLLRIIKRSSSSSNLLFRMEKIADGLTEAENTSWRLFYVVAKTVNFVTLSRALAGEHVTDEEWASVLTAEATQSYMDAETERNMNRLYAEMSSVGEEYGLVEDSPLDERNLAASEEERLRKQKEDDDFFARIAAQADIPEQSPAEEVDPLRETPDSLKTER